MSEKLAFEFVRKSLFLVLVLVKSNLVKIWTFLVQVKDPNAAQDPDAPVPIRWEMFNTTLWCAKSFEAAQPLIQETLLNVVVKPPLHDFGPEIEDQSSLRNLIATEAQNAVAIQKGKGGWDAPSWFLPVIVCISAVAVALLLATCLCIYRWHLARSPPVVTTLKGHPSADGFFTPGSGQNGSFGGSFAGGAGSPYGGGVVTAVQSSSAASSLGHNPLSGGVSGGPSPAGSGSLAPLNPNGTTKSKSHFVASLNSVAMHGDHASSVMHAAGVVRGLQGGPSTGSTDTVKIQRGPAAQVLDPTAELCSVNIGFLCWDGGCSLSTGGA